jgi:endonuclease/exonuclease/phosphatase family metal-dependent hydrolase
MRIRVLSWNIWIHGYFDKIADFLQASNADIIGLQEVLDSDPERDVIGYLNKLGYHHTFAPMKKRRDRKSWNDGPAIFSKCKFLNTQIYKLSNTDRRVAVKTDVQIGNKTLHVFCTHLTHTHQKQTAEQNLQIENLLKLLPREKTILMGDFNATPQSSVIQSMKKIFTNTDPDNNPTWSLYAEGCPKCKLDKINMRLDYIFVSPDMKVKESRVGDSKGSDHLPILADIEIG